MLVVRSAFAVAAAGMFVGVLVSLAATGLLSSLLFSVHPRDPFTLALSAVSLGTVAVLVAAGLAWRCAKMPPSAALRHE
jgi:putative ABC transport system permease protein